MNSEAVDRVQAFLDAWEKHMAVQGDEGIVRKVSFTSFSREKVEFALTLGDLRALVAEAVTPNV